MIQHYWHTGGCAVEVEVDVTLPENVNLTSLDDRQVHTLQVVRRDGNNGSILVDGIYSGLVRISLGCHFWRSLSSSWLHWFLCLLHGLLAFILLLRLLFWSLLTVLPHHTWVFFLSRSLFTVLPHHTWVFFLSRSLFTVLPHHTWVFFLSTSCSAYCCG